MSESTIPEFTEAEAEQLAEAEEEFQIKGGRDVVIAEEIDALKLRRDYVTLTLVVPRSAAETFEQSGVPHFDVNEVMFWYGLAGVTDDAIDAGADPAMWA